MMKPERSDLIERIRQSLSNAVIDLSTEQSWIVNALGLDWLCELAIFDGPNHVVQGVLIELLGDERDEVTPENISDIRNQLCVSIGMTGSSVFQEDLYSQFGDRSVIWAIVPHPPLGYGDNEFELDRYTLSVSDRLPCPVVAPKG